MLEFSGEGSKYAGRRCDGTSVAIENSSWVSAPLLSGGSAYHSITNVLHGPKVSICHVRTDYPLRIVEPYLVEMLIQVVARADPPTPDVGAMGDDPSPPQGYERVRSIIQDPALDATHE